jgi:hypothetical protein
VERVNITVGPVVFDHADYDAECDVLYLHVGGAAGGRGRADARGPCTALRAGHAPHRRAHRREREVVAHRDGHLTLTISEQVQTSADSLAPALVAS